MSEIPLQQPPEGLDRDTTLPEALAAPSNPGAEGDSFPARFLRGLAARVEDQPRDDSEQ